MNSKVASLIESLYLKIPGNLVYYDQMTGVNTRCYYDRVVKEKYKDQEVFIAFIDINNLKKINDEKGHHVGSDIIRDVAKKLSLLNLKEVCRSGGDEFIVIGDKEFDHTNLNYVENVSYGYVIKTKDQTVSEAVKIADQYMYKRKALVHKRANKKKKDNK